MTIQQHRDEVRLELDKIGRAVRELQALGADVADRTPTLREKMAAGALLSQFYMGIENVLKRIAKHHDVPLPQSPRWHADLLERFRAPGHASLPALLDADMIEQLDPYRRFRHVIHHSYGFDLDWSRMKEGVESVDSVFGRFRERIVAYLRLLSS